jgi:hypothetical protein
MLLLPVAIALTLSRRRLRAMGGRADTATESLFLVMMFSIFIGNLVVDFVYFGEGFDSYPVLIFFPIVLPFAYSMIRRIPIPVIGRESAYFAFAILIAAMIGFAALQVDLQTWKSDDRARNIADFWQEHGDKNATMTAGLESYGLFSLSLADANASPPQLLPINSSAYRYLIGANNATDRHADCFLFTSLDFNSPILGADWKYYRPIAQQRLLALEENPYLDRTYDDGMSALFSRL